MADDNAQRYIGSRAPLPPQLGEHETFDSLRQWKQKFRNYYRRDLYYQRFFHPSCTWDPTQPETYGFTAETTGQLKREPGEIKDDLVYVLTSLAGFLPHGHVTDRILNTTCLADVWAILDDIYGAEVNQSTFLDFASLTKKDGETYRQFFERLQSYVRQHLSPANVSVPGLNTGATGDTMTISMLNFIVVIWLQKVDARLPDICKHEYAVELKAGKTLFELMPRIAQAIDSMLQRYDTTLVSRINQLEAQLFEEDESHINRFQNDRNKKKFNKKTNKFGNKPKQSNTCHHCVYIAKDLNIALDTVHDPATCSRKKSVVRRVDASDSSSDQSGVLSLSPISTTHSPNFQNQSLKSLPTLPVPKTSESVFNSQNCSPILSACHEDLPVPQMSPISEETLEVLSESLINSVQHWRQATAVAKARSPALAADINGLPVTVIIDEGAEVSCLDAIVAKRAGVQVDTTMSRAKAAGNNKVNIVGQSQQPLLLNTKFQDTVVTLNLGHVLVVDKLGSDVLLGEPGKQSNCIFTVPHKQQISIQTGGKMLSKSYLGHVKKKLDYHLIKAVTTDVIHPGEDATFQLPQRFNFVNAVSVIPAREHARWFSPSVHNHCQQCYPATLFSECRLSSMSTYQLT